MGVGDLLAPSSSPANSFTVHDRSAIQRLDEQDRTISDLNKISSLMVIETIPQHPLEKHWRAFSSLYSPELIGGAEGCVCGTFTFLPLVAPPLFLFFSFAGT